MVKYIHGTVMDELRERGRESGRNDVPLDSKMNFNNVDPWIRHVGQSDGQEARA